MQSCMAESLYLTGALKLIRLLIILIFVFGRTDLFTVYAIS